MVVPLGGDPGATGGVDKPEQADQVRFRRACTDGAADRLLKPGGYGEGACGPKSWDDHGTVVP
jgi:hypothetical protein